MIPTERSIFLEALDIKGLEARSRYLDLACGNDTDLRKGVDALLAADRREDHLIDQPLVQTQDLSTIGTGPGDPFRRDPKTGHFNPNDFRPNHAASWTGQTIGSYRLLELIGEGGFGLVFVAQQDQPVRRKVALKVLKPGMDRKEVLARFAAEQQAVAMMDHPHIAKVYDAGVTPEGRPYFVMEWIHGIPINQYADQDRLTVDERLTLFLDLCGAIHHAHQKAVIHRDIKPSNVLVADHDDQPVVKVIDFGIAKAIGHSLTDQTVHTRLMGLMGTPMYMSPEQAEINRGDMDIRSDVYSLGVMLYELLVGCTPFERDRLDAAGLDELRRIIRDEDPPRPSRRLTAMGNRATAVSAARRTEPGRLNSILRGDLDWIVMKALEKDRNRRYDSVLSMAEDMRRFQRQQPILARPPSRTYRAAKFIRRRRFILIPTTLIVFTVVVGLMINLWQARRVVRERRDRQALQREIEHFASQVTRPQPSGTSGETIARPQSAGSSLDRAHFFARQSLWGPAASDFDRALELTNNLDSPHWWGVPALLQIQQRPLAMERYFELYIRTLKEMAQSKTMTKPDWQWIRSGLVVPDRLTGQQYVWLAQVAISKLPKEPGPGLPGEGHHGGPPYRNPDRRRRDEDRSDDFRRYTPPPLQYYIAGLAQLRAGLFDSSVEYFEQAIRMGGPDAYLIHAPLAMAYQAIGHPVLSKDHFERSRQFAKNNEDVKSALARPNRSPWYQPLEFETLYQEAKKVLEE